VHERGTQLDDVVRDIERIERGISRRAELLAPLIG
jgi:hypothetical protein